MKQKISVAARQLKPKDLSRNHYTTLGFGTPFPVFVEETIPRDKFTFKVSNFSRLAPMYLPNLGTINLKVHAFYVPFHQVWNHFENFVNGLPSWNSKGAQVYKFCPKVDDASLTSLFTTAKASGISYSEVVQDIGSEGGYDFSITEETSEEVFETTFYKFTKRGKEIYHILCALGYNFNFTSPNGDGQINNEYSALPLLCWLKLFMDYFVPSQLQPSSAINQALSSIHDMTAAQMNSVINIQLIDTLLDEVMLYYQNNYFTSAWMSPNAPVSGLNNIGSTVNDRPVINGLSHQGRSLATSSTNNINNFVHQPLENTDLGVSRTYNDQASASTGSLSNPMTADGINFMQKFARYVKRSNFAGSRAVERILARFGVRVDDFQIGMSKYLGSDTITLNKSDVVVTGSEQEAGSYTGKGWFSGGSRTFKCNCDFAGMIFVTASLETPSTFVDGVRRRCMHMQPLDFYTPELDGGVMQAISGNELFGRVMDDNITTSTDITNLGLRRSDVFGFTPRYSEYKFALDDVTSDFALPRFAQNIDGFILPRRLFNNLYRYQMIMDDPTVEDSFKYSSYAYDSVLEDGDKTVTPIRTLYTNDADQFNRIFRDISGEADPVFSVFRIDCVVNSCSIPLNESAELVGKGKLLDFETNGVHVS